ncbi:unnamed protein product [Cyclocybe aegerita]|uniref:Uncharacterized protein n=1 Tax=Cyclocybe aegerita TaxID=1973307 RepID=A0A8S0WCL1_CYCAE|nr:unnamed protein product [Cyclocybe aegerita]
MALQDFNLASLASLQSLPLELIESLDQTYFLYLLVTDPARVIPPGKSLLSMLTHAKFHPPEAAQNGSQHVELLGRVKEVAHRAFWEEATEALSSPLPSVQLERLKRLYLDLYDALTPLFPPNHRILVSLCSPLPPTSSPLHSTLNFLREVLSVLRERCAPARDEAIDLLISSILQPPSGSSPNGTHTDTSSTPLAEFVVDKIRAIVSLGEDMKEDLNNFVLGSMTEAQLNGLLLDGVKQRERDIVLQIWGGPDLVRRLWRNWFKGGLVEDSDCAEGKRWIKRLLKALQSDKPVQCAPPSPPESHLNGAKDNLTKDASSSQGSHLLPPQLLFCVPNLVSVQNHLQALVITASLRSLTRLPSAQVANSGSGSSTTPSVVQEFIPRVWSLLKAEIDDEAPVSDIDHTKLVNLADEVVRARQLTAKVGGEEETQLRSAVERTLRSNDPVFLLLGKRLIGVLESLLVSENPVNDINNDRPTIPAKMQTGRDFVGGRAVKRPKLTSSEPTLGGAGPVRDDAVKFPLVAGYEDETLREAIWDVFHKLSSCIAWTENIWGM